ncbi:MAG TPA: NAD-dependent epimerase/dehydratase family protein [Candidatus Brocadiaceae bacterium]|nr:MAG: hypothetical protein A2Y09_07915 [Planctomycetes bacterium GWA2_39_15]
MDVQKYYNGKKILLLGGAGFIGSNLAEEFVNSGAKVTVVDGFVQYTGGNIRNIQNFIGKINLYNCKVENLNCLKELVEDSDFIIDSMALTSHGYGIEYPIMDVQLNILSHLQLINALKGTQNKKILYLGSRGQYGNSKEAVITEETPQNPIDPQGISKVATESFFKFYAEKYGFKGVSLRITNCFGEYQKINGDDIGLVGSLIRDILKGETVEIYGTKERKKNIIYVKDLIKIILELIKPDFNNFEVYNIAGLEVTLGSLLDSIIENIGRGNYVVKPFPAAIKQIDVGDAKFSDKKISAKIGKLELSDLNRALANTIRYFEE